MLERATIRLESGNSIERPEQARRVRGAKWRSAAMQECAQFVQDVARMPRQPVYLYGESGVGKTVIARDLHRMRRTTDAPFEPILLAGLGAEIAASELFGSERGAFTGAVCRLGLLRIAAYGTAFLDEIAKTPTEVQAQLLHLLDDRTICPVGGRTRILLDVDVVAASSGDPFQAVADGALLHDLLARFEGFTLRVPALRERREDLPELILAATSSVCEFLGREQAPDFTDALMAELTAAYWPSNFRGLQAALKWILMQAGEADEVGVEMLTSRVRTCMGVTRADAARLTDEDIRSALARTGNNQSAAAMMLGCNRSTIQRRTKGWEREA